MNLKAFIFDMDGVIIDSEPLQLRAYNKVLNRFDVDLSMDDFKKHYMGTRDTQICSAMVRDFQISIDSEKFLEEKRLNYLDFIKNEKVPPIPGAIEAINSLSQKLPLAIASSSWIQNIELITANLGIRDKFKVVFSAHDVANGKPAPDVYLKTAELLGVSPAECGAIEDTPTGIKSAKAAGMFCVGITVAYPKEKLSEADRIIESFNELIPILDAKD